MTTDAADGGAPEYDLALVCGRGDRTYVDDVHAHLKERGVRVYAQGHDDHIVLEWGENLPDLLDRLIRRQVRYAVLFVSKHLSESLANYQRKLALGKLVTLEDSAFVLPVRLDDAELRGLPLDSIGIVDARQTTAGDLAQMLEHKLQGRVFDGAVRPRVEVHVERDPGRPPRAVAIRNIGTIPIGGCVYVARLADPLQLRAWYLTPPSNLAPGDEIEHVLRTPHGVERATYARTRTMVDARLSSQLVMVLVPVRAFENEEEAAGERRGAPERDGLRFPPSSLFTNAAAPAGDGYVEAVIFGTAEGRLHRLLQHHSRTISTLQPDDERPGWATWYERTARRGLRPPAAVTRPLPLPFKVGGRPLRR